MRALGKGTYTRIMRAYDKHASARILLKNECAQLAYRKKLIWRVVSLWCMTERGDVHMCDVWFSEVMYDPTGDVCVMCRPVGL